MGAGEKLKVVPTIIYSEIGSFVKTVVGSFDNGYVERDVDINKTLPASIVH